MSIRISGIIRVCDKHGRLLDSVEVKAKNVVYRDAIHVVNQGSALEIEDIEVREWDGVRGVRQDAYVVTKDGQQLEATIQGFDAQTNEFILQLDGRRRSSAPSDHRTSMGKDRWGPIPAANRTNWKKRLSPIDRMMSPPR